MIRTFIASIRALARQPLDLAPYEITHGDRVRARQQRRELSHHAYSVAEAKRLHGLRLRLVGGRA